MLEKTWASMLGPGKGMIVMGKEPKSWQWSIRTPHPISLPTQVWERYCLIPLQKTEASWLKTSKGRLHIQRQKSRNGDYMETKGVRYQSPTPASPPSASSTSQTQFPEHSQASTTSVSCPATTVGLWQSVHSKSGQAKGLLAMPSGCKRGDCIRSTTIATCWGHTLAHLAPCQSHALRSGNRSLRLPIKYLEETSNV